MGFGNSKIKRFKLFSFVINRSASYELELKVRGGRASKQDKIFSIIFYFAQYLHVRRITLLYEEAKLCP